MLKGIERILKRSPGLKAKDIAKELGAIHKVRYRGLEKNTAQLFSLFGLANLMLAKRYLQRVAG